MDGKEKVDELSSKVEFRYLIHARTLSAYDDPEYQMPSLHPLGGIF